MKTNVFMMVAVAMAAALVFAIDQAVPLGVAGGVPYVAVVALALYSSDRRVTIVVALVCSLLVAVGYAASPLAGSAEMWKVLANRGLACFAIWAMAAVVLWEQARMRQTTERPAAQQDATRTTSELPLAAVWREPTVWMFVALLVVAGGILAGHQWRVQQELVVTTVRDDARAYSQALTAFRTLYTSEVVEPLRRRGVRATHDYDVTQGEIPLPATLSIDLGEAIGRAGSGVRSRLHSPYPFPWRGEVGQHRDKFARDAWESLTRNPGRPFVRQENVDGQPLLRYATADLMRKSCIDCHNQHPESPRHDWQTGDVRGVLEVDVPMDRTIAQSFAGLRQSLTLFGIFAAVSFSGVALVISRLRRSSGELEREVQQRTSELSQEIREREKYQQQLERNAEELQQSRTALQNKAREADVARKKAEEAEQRLRVVIEAAPNGMVMVNRAGEILLVNSQMERLFGYGRDELVGAQVDTLVPRQFQAEHPQHREDFFAEPTVKMMSERLDLFGLRKDGGEFPVEIGLSPVETSSGLFVLAVVTDVTQRKQAERDLRESQERFELAVRGTTDGLWDWDILTDTEWWSERFYSLLGYERGEIEAHYATFLRLVHAEDRAATLEAVQAHLEDRVVYDFEFRLRTKSSNYRWFRSRGQAVWDETGKPLRMAGSIQDITDRRQAEERIKAEQQLLRRLLDVQENERRMVAHDIHDGFLQQVVGAHLQVGSINTATDPQTVEATLEIVGSLLKKAIAEGRCLIRDLRPMVLDEAGVVEAIKHLVADERKYAGLIVAFEHDVRFGRLEPKLEGTVFRIVQEALNNVKHHAQTDHAAVQLTQHNGTLQVVIRDQGVGFDLKQVSPDRFGLRGIRERARLFGGAARIESAPGEGTGVWVEMPIQTPLDEARRDNPH